jgi:hypothetical protein
MCVSGLRAEALNPEEHMVVEETPSGSRKPSGRRRDATYVETSRFGGIS